MRRLHADLEEKREPRETASASQGHIDRMSLWHQKNTLDPGRDREAVVPPLCPGARTLPFVHRPTWRQDFSTKTC